MFKAPDLSGRVAIVTGASRGVGKALALGLAKAGCDVCVAAKSTVERDKLPGTIGITRDEVEAMGRRAIAVKTDVRDDEQIAAMVEQTVQELGRVDILINNAGALWWRSVLDTPMKRFDLVMGVNARASFSAAQAVLPHMIEQRWGHILNLSPPLDPSFAPGKVAYSISKFGMTLIAHGLAAEVKKLGVAANALWPCTAIESQATINHKLGTPRQWRKPDILVDAALAIFSHEPPELTGQALLDEDILGRHGVEDFSPYRCDPEGTEEELLRIAGPGAVRF